MPNRASALLGLLAALFSAAASPAQCIVDWASGFEPAGLAGWDAYPGAYALAIFDDGSGPALYVGGSFRVAGNVPAEYLAKWDAQTWSALANDFWGQVNTLCVFDDGTGPALYAGGSVPGHAAKWNGEEWLPLGAGVRGEPYAMLVFDDGAGPALYVGGEFDAAGGLPAKCIAKWDGTTWSALGSGMYHYDFYPTVYALAVYDDGTGPALYAGGHFTSAGGVTAYNIARWDAQTWSAVGQYGVSSTVRALLVYDDGAGPGLCAGGDFSYADYVLANNIARWDGSAWSALASGIAGDWEVVWALATFDDGAGEALYAGGGFVTAGGASAICIARWDGASWSALGTGTYGTAHTLHVFDDGRGPALYAGGEFTVAGAVGAHRIARWDGHTWSALGTGNGLSDYPMLNGFAVLDLGAGPALYVAGFFDAAGGVAAHHVARWDGSTWTGLGTDAVWSAGPLTVYDDGAGPALYVAGDFSTGEGVSRWDGASWSLVGAGGQILSLGALDDASGPALYAGGRFTTLGGVSANSIARWDGQSWSALGDGLTHGYTDPLEPAHE